MKKSPLSSVKKSETSENPLLVVAIGASAGGLEAVSELFQHLPPDTGMSFVYIQHLDPTYKSMLSNILAKTMDMTVLEAQNMMKIEPNQVYVIPASQDMELINDVLTLVPRKPKPAPHLPIDQFFLSLAEQHGMRAIAIVLSGNASDGTAGLKAVKMAGGITIAQDESAKFQSMPRSAIAEGVVDLVLSPKEIARELERLSKKTSLIQSVIVEAEAEDSTVRDEDLRNIIQLINKSAGVDFSHYKINTIKRRIVRRMLLHKLDNLHDYVQYLRQHAAEIDILYNDLLINVTSFFRDSEAVDFLKKNLLPNALKRKAINDPLRIWVPACSTGEEAYSMAIIITEVLGENADNMAIQIFATDLSAPAIAKARQALYSPNELTEVSPKRLQRFFTKVDGHYRIIKSIRDRCIFAPHNIFKDPPFSRLDVISCCNLLIYLDPVLQKKIIAAFHYSLNPDGYLILGKSESIGSSTQLFSQIDKQHKIYIRKNETSARSLFEMNRRLPDLQQPEAPILVRPNTPEVRSNELGKVVDQLLLQQYVPASVVINQELEILQFRGSTGLFLEPLPGKASLNLLKMARPGLIFELRNAVHKAGKSNHPIKKTALEIKHHGRSHYVSIEVVPIKSDPDERLFLVVFTETVPATPTETQSGSARDTRTKQLESELAALREDMRSIVEDQEASNEELQSANEEILSSNEELQSMNEEMQTSKEEVESTNEELITTNQELQVRNDQLAEAYEYSEAVLTTMREALLILDKNLRVRSANQSFYKMFQLREEEVEGQVIFEVGNNHWNFPKLRELLEEIIPHNAQFHGFEISAVFPKVGEKSLVLNARKIIQQAHAQQLILLAIEDVTENKEARRVLAERETWFQNMADNAPVMIWVANAAIEFTFFNRTWLEYTGRILEQEVNKGWLENVYPDDLPQVLAAYHDSFKDRIPYQQEYRLRRHDGEYRWVMVIGKPTFSDKGGFNGFIGTCVETHAQKMQKEELETRVQQRTKDLGEANTNLAHTNHELEQFAYVASHDLQEPLRKIQTFSDRLQKRHGDLLPSEGKVYLERIVASTQRMSRLIDELLSFSRAVRGDQAFGPTDLSKIVQDVLSGFDLAITQNEAMVKVGPLPVISAIPLQMQQLFHNLLGNALKFVSPRRKPLISITARTPSAAEVRKFNTVRKPEDYIEIIVQDNGIGFDQSYAEQIFEIFQRLHGKLEYSGTGIGLALCHRIVNNHGGEIFAEAEEDQGASFHVLLPLLHPEA